MEFIAIFILGIFVGSFLNVLVDRLPREESVIKGRSHCEKCKKTLKWHDLIPLISFISLKGKCRYCHTSLSFYYPIIEIITGLMFVLALNISGFVNYLNLIYYIILFSALIVIFFTDLKYGIIPDVVLFPLIFISLLYLFLNNHLSIVDHLFSAGGAFLFFLLLFLITRGKGMGFGDVKFAFLMGLILGFPKIIVSLYVAFLTGAIVGCILIMWRKKKVFGTSIPFGPFLVIGILVAILYGEILVQGFSRLALPL